MEISATANGQRFPRLNFTQQTLIGLFAEFFCLRSAEAAALLRGRTPSESDARSVRRTLGILLRKGLLSRLPYLHPEQLRGGTSYVYGLSRKGVAWVFANGSATDGTKVFSGHSPHMLDHELEITAFHSQMAQFSRESGWLLSWRQRNLKHSVHPDALFALSDPQQPGEIRYFFLEIERAKLGNYRNGEPQILRKLAAYHRYFDSTDCQKEWGFRRFRVIVVQRTEARREGLLRLLEAEHRHRMFWLTTEEAYRKNISGHIFKTPKDYASGTFDLLGRSAAIG